ncbi:MAG TPA: SDR family NAD(P)-dependent oxidoreductase [Candidatus Paceibacterota bacterium]|nr:SDR family NAD(P)-dependent oxidoreductase [Candidatus Paceibacterota bacterium]
MKTAVVTGAQKGIGFATAKKFLDNGWKVIGTYHGAPAPFASENLISVPLELTSPQDIARAAEDIKKVAPEIDVLVNNAGVLLDSSDPTVNMDILRKTFEVNVFGLIDFTERMIPLMHAGSHILNMDSGYGSFSEPIDDATSSAYRISKAALNMYTRVAALHVKEKGIIVSSIAPGWVKTDMGVSIASDTEKPDRTPEDAANDIYNLAIANPESGFFWEYGKKRDW